MKLVQIVVNHHPLTLQMKIALIIYLLFILPAAHVKLINIRDQNEACSHHIHCAILINCICIPPTIKIYFRTPLASAI